MTSIPRPSQRHRQVTIPCSRSLGLGPSEKPMMRVAGEVKDVARLAAGALDRPLSVLELPALFEVRDAPNLCINTIMCHLIFFWSFGNAGIRGIRWATDEFDTPEVNEVTKNEEISSLNKYLFLGVTDSLLYGERRNSLPSTAWVQKGSQLPDTQHGEPELTPGNLQLH